GGADIALLPRRFFLVAVQQDHDVAVDGKNYASLDLPAPNRRADLAQTLSDRARRRHSDRPAKFDFCDIPPDDATILDRQSEQPLAHREISRRRFIEARRQAFHHSPPCPATYRIQYEQASKNAPYAVRTMLGNFSNTSSPGPRPHAMQKSTISPYIRAGMARLCRRANPLHPAVRPSMCFRQFPGRNRRHPHAISRPNRRHLPPGGRRRRRARRGGDGGD